MEEEYLLNFEYNLRTVSGGNYLFFICGRKIAHFPNTSPITDKFCRKESNLVHRGLKLDGPIGQGKFVTPSIVKIFQNPSCPILGKIK